MWRFFQGIPRSVCNRWNVRPGAQSTCRDEKREVSVEHASVQALLPRAQHAHTGPTRRCWGREHQHARRHERRPGEEEGGPEKDWAEWLKAFRKEFWSTSRCPHNLLEAVGWGTAVILGIQLSQVWKLEELRRNSNGTAVRPWSLYHLAFAMPGQGTRTARSILGSSSNSHKAPVKGLDDEQSHHSHSNEDSLIIDFESSSSRPLPELQNEASAGAKDHFAEASKEWEKLCTLYTNVSQNFEAFQLAEQGKMTKAAHLWKATSDRGYAKAHYNLGLCYELGKGVPKNLCKAVEHYRLAAEEGHSKAVYNLAIMYLQGQGGLHKDPQLAIQLMEQAAQQGLTQAQRELGILYTEEDRKDMRKAASLFELAAEQGDTAGQYYLGICYENGWGLVQDQTKAAQLYRRAADTGHAGAQYNLAVFLENGLGGLPEDLGTALDMYTASAQGGNNNAQQQAKLVENKLHRAKEDASKLESFLMTAFPAATIAKSKRKSIPKQTMDKTNLSSKALSGSASSPTLVDYFRKHMLEVGFGDFSDTQGPYEEDIMHTQHQALRRAPVSTPAVTSARRIHFLLGEASETDTECYNDTSQRDYKPYDTSVADIEKLTEDLSLTRSHSFSGLPGSASSQDLRSVACT